MSALLIAAALAIAPVTPPKAALILPVERMVDGCPVPKVVRYDADRDGSFTKAP